MKSVLPLLILALCTGCDPARRILIRNASEDVAVITWIMKKDSLAGSPFFISLSDTTRFVLRPSPPYNRVNMTCGTGNWSRTALEELTDDLEALEVRYSGGSFRLQGVDSIRNFLRPRRTGLDKAKILLILR